MTRSDVVVYHRDPPDGFADGGESLGQAGRMDAVDFRGVTGKPPRDPQVYVPASTSASNPGASAAARAHGLGDLAGDQPGERLPAGVTAATRSARATPRRSGCTSGIRRSRTCSRSPRCASIRAAMRSATPTWTYTGPSEAASNLGTFSGCGGNAGLPKLACMAHSIWCRSRTRADRSVRKCEIDAMVRASLTRCRGFLILLVSM